MASDAQTLVDHLQQRGVLQSSCHSLFVCQLFVHCRLTKETNDITVLQTFISYHIHFSPTCFLGSVRPRSDVNINLRADRKKKAQRWDVGWKICRVFIP